jgi:hypothetical protein
MQHCCVNCYFYKSNEIVNTQTFIMTQRLLLCLVYCLTTWTLSAQLSPITSVQLEFTANGSNTVTATATDSGSGLAVDGDINLTESTAYTLSITLFNGTNDITSEVTANADQLQFFFAASEGLLEGDPSYNDMDSNMLPVGLSSTLTGTCVSDSDIMGTLRVALKDLGDQKAASSTIDDGTAIFDLNWNVNIMDDPDAPACENEEEVIDLVTLTFTPVAGGDPVVATASDPDGPGPLDLVVEEIELLESTEYQLSITLQNTIEGEDITAEIMEEDDEHLFLFAFGEDVFESPDGDGNIDNIADPVNYVDQDDNGLPVGLLTSWTTACVGDHDHDHGDGDGEEEETFRVVLKHQPGLKSATSGFDVGGTDLDITWEIHIMDDPDAPACENEEEVIDLVTLTFAPVAGGDTVVVTASDPDGPGPLDLMVEDISLEENTEYQLTIALDNTIEGESITAEILEEDDEHQFFFGWTGDIFSDPTGDGNIDNGTDPINYNDQDDNGLPVGLSTSWTTNVAMSAGTFRIALKHQPGIKSATSGFDDGGTDLDITWNINSVVSNTRAQQDLNRELLLSPNPTRDYLFWDVESLRGEEVTIRILNLQGQVLQQMRSNGNRLNVAQLPTGTYVFQVLAQDGIRVSRFVKR